MIRRRQELKPAISRFTSREGTFEAMRPAGSKLTPANSGRSATSRSKKLKAPTSNVKVPVVAFNWGQELEVVIRRCPPLVKRVVAGHEIAALGEEAVDQDPLLGR